MEGSRKFKFRHVFGSIRMKSGYEALKPRASRDSSLIQVNSKFVAFQWQTGGFGALVILPNRDMDIDNKIPARVPQPAALIEAHKSYIVDFKFSNFDENLIATTDSGIIKLWKIPESGIVSNVKECFDEISGPLIRRPVLIQFHPTSSNLLTIACKDNSMCFFDIEKSDELLTFEGHKNVIQSWSWDWEGSKLASSCKDKNCRIIDPRQKQIATTVEAHSSGKGFSVCWLGQRDWVLTAGFNNSGERQISTWDIRAFDKSLMTTTIDNSPCNTVPYYDPGTGIVFLLGKGDSLIRYYGIINTSPFTVFLDQYRAADTHSDIAAFPRRICDPSICEIARFARLKKDKIEHVMFRVPRKGDSSKIFHEDLYTTIPSFEATTTAKQWLDGEKSPPILIIPEDLKPDHSRSIFEIDPTRRESKLDLSQSSTEDFNTKKNPDRRNEFTGSSGSNIEMPVVFDSSKFLQPSFEETSPGKVNLKMLMRSSTSLDHSQTLDEPNAHSEIQECNTDVPSKGEYEESTEMHTPNTKLHQDVQMEDNIREGNDSIRTSRNSIFEGTWKGGMREGNGKLTFTLPDNQSITLESIWENNKLIHSKSKFFLPGKIIIEKALFSETKELTYCKISYPDGSVYEGGLLNGLRSGNGSLKCGDGSVYTGDFISDLRHGLGVYKYADGRIYDGTWKGDLPHGEGKFSFKETSFEGTWVKGELKTVK